MTVPVIPPVLCVRARYVDCPAALRQPLPGCRVISLTALADGALLSADAGGNAQAVCCIQRRLNNAPESAAACVGVFIIDVAVDMLSIGK